MPEIKFMKPKERLALVQQIQAAIAAGEREKADALIEKLPKAQPLSRQAAAWREVVLHLASLIHHGQPVIPGERVACGWKGDGERDYVEVTPALAAAARAVVAKWSGKRKQAEAEPRQTAAPRPAARSRKTKKAPVAAKSTGA